MKINMSQWQEFDFSKVFLITRGKRLKTSDQISGDIAYISSTKKNNGIDNYVVPPDDIPIFNNAITINIIGSIGFCFYHSYDFIASDNCAVLNIKDKNIQLNAILFLFLKPVLEVMKSKYSYARTMNIPILKKEKILLPAKHNLPDWKYMEKYIKDKAKDVVYDNPVIYPKNTISLNSVQWQEFGITGIFNLSRGQRLIKKDRDPGYLEYYSASEYNNGLTDLISNPLFVESNAIIYTTFGDCFWVGNDFTASDEVSILKHKHLNEYTGLFVVTIIQKNKYKYDFGRKAFSNKFCNDIILLPANKNNEPDWQFMEDYIKSLPYSKSLR